MCRDKWVPARSQQPGIGPLPAPYALPPGCTHAMPVRLRRPAAKTFVLCTAAGTPLCNPGASPVRPRAAAGRLGPPSPPRGDRTRPPAAPIPRTGPLGSTSVVPLPALSWQLARARAAARRQQRLFAATEDLSLPGCSLLDAFQATGLDDTNPAGFTARARIGEGLGGCPAVAPLGNGAARAGGCPGLHRDPGASRGGGRQTWG